MAEETTSIQNKDLSIFQINDLMKDTYNKIAKWHNDDASSDGLKSLSIELIEDIAGAAYTHVGIPYQEGTKIRMDEETRKKVEAEKERIRLQSSGD